MIGGADLERGAVTAGGRGYYLMGPAVCLQVNFNKVLNKYASFLMIKGIVVTSAATNYLNFSKVWYN